MENKLTLEKIFQGSSAALAIKKMGRAEGLQREITAITIRHINRWPFVSRPTSKPFIGILSAHAFQPINQGEHKEKKQVFLPKGLIFLLASGSVKIPAFLVNNLQKNDIPLAVSTLDKDHLKSRLTGLLREKLYGKVFFHGAAFKTGDKGVMLLGPSGIGKTTAVLDFVRQNNFWIADDYCEVSKSSKGELIIRSHKKIAELVHIRQKGILSVYKVLGADRVLKKTKLQAVINVASKKIPHPQFKMNRIRILNSVLPCLDVGIPQGSYFDKNLLKKCIEKLFEASR
jgi:HPr kinase/phosphorylase